MLTLPSSGVFLAGHFSLKWVRKAFEINFGSPGIRLKFQHLVITNVLPVNLKSAAKDIKENAK